MWREEKRFRCKRCGSERSESFLTYTGEGLHDQNIDSNAEAEKWRKAEKAPCAKCGSLDGFSAVNEEEPDAEEFNMYEVNDLDGWVGVRDLPPAPAKTPSANTPPRKEPIRFDYRFECPKCRTGIRAKIAHVGRDCRCGPCGSVVKIPPPKA